MRFTIIGASSFVLLLGSPAIAQPRSAAGADGPAFGFAVQRFQDDFGLSGLVASPAVVGDTLRAVGAGGIAWYPHAFDARGHETWKAYALSAGALVYVGATHLLPQAESEPKRYSLLALGGGVLVSIALVLVESP